MLDDDAKQELARSFVAGLIDGDLGRMRSALHDDATWSVPGDTTISGTADGAASIIERASAIAGTDDLSIRLERVLYGEHTVAVLLHNTGRRGDVRLDEMVFVVLTPRGSKIAAVENLISDVPGLNAFFAVGTT